MFYTGELNFIPKLILTCAYYMSYDYVVLLLINILLHALVIETCAETRLYKYTAEFYVALIQLTFHTSVFTYLIHSFVFNRNVTKFPQRSLRLIAITLYIYTYVPRFIKAADSRACTSGMLKLHWLMLTRLRN